MVKSTIQKEKAFGQYYTPQYIVHFIIDQTLGHLLRNYTVNQAKNIKILDPACGLGIFLVYSHKYFQDYYKEKQIKIVPSREKRKSIIAHQIYGIDIDPSQIEQTIQNLQCYPFNANFKVFNALLPPVGYAYGFDVSKLMELRKLMKDLYIKGNNRDLLKIKTQISEVEEKVKRNLIKELKEEFNISSNHLNPMIWGIAFPEVIGGFDIIIGNPPWGADNLILTTDILNSYNAGTQQVDTWSLFIEQSINALKIDGRLGFIIPSTLMSNENYSPIRQFILNNCRITNIVNLGENIFTNVTQPCMILILEKGPLREEDRVSISKYVSSETLNNLKEKKITLSSLSTISCSQSRFQNNPDFQIDIFAIGYEEILSCIEKDLYQDQIQVKPLSSLVYNARGVEINKKGRIFQCSECKWWNSPPLRFNKSGIKLKKCVNPKCDNTINENDYEDYIVFNNLNKANRDLPFLVGHQIQRYYLHKHKYIDPTRIGINYKKPVMYHGPKLLLRKTGKGIKLVIDYHDRWVNQVIYFFKLKDDTSITLEYLLGVLNSSLIQKYFYLKYADPYRSDFPHLTQKIFLKLPIKIPILNFENELANQIHITAIRLQSEYQRIYDQKMNQSEELLINQSIVKLEKKMNDLVFSLYHLTSHQQDQIRSLFSNIFNERITENA